VHYVFGHLPGGLRLSKRTVKERGRRNPKSESRNIKQIRNKKSKSPKLPGLRVLIIPFSDFRFVSYFVFRASRFMRCGAWAVGGGRWAVGGGRWAGRGGQWG